jgi:hypothetical protein
MSYCCMYKTLKNTCKSKKPRSCYKEQFSTEFKNNKYYGLILYKIIYSIFYSISHIHFNYRIPIQQGRFYFKMIIDSMKCLKDFTEY